MDSELRTRFSCWQWHKTNKEEKRAECWRIQIIPMSRLNLSWRVRMRRMW